ncbi:MAG: hypothetical protein Q8O33_00510 [Pseudomonadota bacterium]|nr:hypothetical protein [Pseudomonadota bacterium]
MSTVFRGVFADSLGGFLTVRGYARLGDLARCSSADPAYQRELKPLHQSEIEAFFRRGEYLFFPEVVLSLELLADYDKPGAPAGEPALLVRTGEAFRSNVNGIDIKPTKTKTAADLARVNITIPATAGKVLKRIDGNHRLSAFEALADPEFDRYVAPFCIVIFPSSHARQNEKALFYNINSKALTLTSEEVYKGIVDEPSFQDDLLARDFGPEFVLCRQVRQRLDFDYLPDLRGVFGQNEGGTDSRCSVLIESLRVIQKLRPDHPLPDTKTLLVGIREVNTAYADNRLSVSASFGLFAAFLHFQLLGGSLYRQFTQWVLKNHLYELQQINALDAIRIFEKVAQSRKRQIFVSMQFSTETLPNFEAIKAAVDDLNQAHKLDIKLRKIRIDQFNTGYSYEINAEILRLIEESGYLIADLTAGNKNVYHEIGFLMGLNQGKGLPHENFLLLHNGGIGDTAKDVGFNLHDFKQIRVKDTNTLREEVKRQVAAYYGLADETASA